MNKKRWIALAAALLVSTLLVYGMEGVNEQSPNQAGRWQEQHLEGEGMDKIAVIPVVGPIVSASEGGGFGAPGAVAENLVSQLRQAADDDAVKAAILRIDTPGGSVVASNLIAREIEELQRAGKPVVAQMGEVAASGGYLISAPAERIVADPATLTGSIGVIMVLINLEDASGKLGIEPVVLKAGRFKDMGSSFRDLTRRERRMFQDLLDEAHESFRATVAEGRDISESELDRVADGRIFSGQQAHELGLVDELGSFDQAIEQAKELADLEDAQVVEYRAEFGLVDLFRGFPSALADRAGLKEETQRAFGVTGPRLAYLYVP